MRRLTNEERDLVEETAPKLAAVAMKYAERAGTDADDAAQDAAMGLIDAATRWRPDKGAAFATFGVYRAIGAMRDAARAAGGLIRIRRSASPDEARRALWPKSLSTSVTPDGRHVLAELIEDAELTDPLNHVDTDLLWRRIEALGPKALAIFEGYYRESLPMHRIAQRLGISESRVSQIHSWAIEELRRTTTFEEIAS